MANFDITAAKVFSLANALQDARVIDVGYHAFVEVKAVLIGTLADQFESLTGLFESKFGVIKGDRKIKRSFSERLKAFHRCSFRAMSDQAVSMKLEYSYCEAALGECGGKGKRAPTTKFIFAGKHEASDITINAFGEIDGIIESGYRRWIIIGIVGGEGRLAEAEIIELCYPIEDVVVGQHGVEIGDILITKRESARMKTTSGRRPERGNVGTKADGGINVKVHGSMIRGEYGIKGKNSALLNGRDKIRRYKDVVEAFAATRVGTCLVGAVSTSDGVTEMVFGDDAIKAIYIVANAFVEVTREDNRVIS